MIGCIYHDNGINTFCSEELNNFFSSSHTLSLSDNISNASCPYSNDTELFSFTNIAPLDVFKALNSIKSNSVGSDSTLYDVTCQLGLNILLTSSKFPLSN